jgi:hypothetical protein
MGKIILYPFSIKQDNKVSYTKALNLAKELSAKVVCFSVAPDEGQLEETYFHLLNLNGHYQTTISAWKPLEIKVESVVKVGDWETTLSQYLEDKKIDILINLPSVQSLEEPLLEAIIKKSGQEVKIFSFSE